MQQRDISGYNGIYQRNKDLRRRDSAAVVLKKFSCMHYIHYSEYGSEWDEWVAPANIKK